LITNADWLRTVPDVPDRQPPGDGVAELRARHEALQQTATMPGADLRPLLDAALAELDGAIDALGTAQAQPLAAGKDERAAGSVHAERRLLHAVFQEVPTPLFVLGQDGTVRRANPAASALLGAARGYPTGKPFSALVEPSGRPAVRSLLAAAARTEGGRQLDCQLLTGKGRISCVLDVRPVTIRGGDDWLLVAARARPAAATGAGSTAASPAARLPAEQATPDPMVTVMTRRLDLATTASRLLLENVTLSESVTLQRCARLLSEALGAWVIVDMDRSGLLRRHFVTGPDKHESGPLTQAVAAVNPEPGSLPAQVRETGSTLLVTHAEDNDILGAGPGGVPLLALLGTGSVLSVPLADSEQTHGVLTLARDPARGYFSLADVGLVEEIAEQLALAMSVRRMLRSRTETAEALQASLIPPVLRAVPGVEIASAHMAPTRGRAVGGDFYDVHPTPAGWGVAIGDVCGKGEDAASVTAVARHAIRVLAHWSADPAEVLRGANEIMLAEEFGSRFVTASTTHLSWSGRSLQAVLGSAGHPGPVLVRPDGRAQVLAGGGLPLGIFPDAEPVTHELELATGDVLFFCTDGLTDARSPEQAYFEGSLTDSLSTLAGKPPADIVSGMRRLVLDFCAGVLLDDLTMLVLRVGEPPGA
jgi:serine phosphatase RsbU (regulator of sigma subunit)/PAS domain-containing protein